MGKMLKKGVLFFTVLLVLLFLASIWISALAAGMADRVQGRNRPVAGITAEEGDTVDLLVVGDSESYTSVSTMDLWKQYGTASYVCGQGGQRIQEAYYMLKTAFRTQSPKVVMVETNMMFRDPGIFKNAQISLAEPLRYYLPVFRYHNLWKLLLDEPKEMTSDYKGFVIKEKITSCKGAEYMKETGEMQELPEFVRFYMRRIQDLCERNGAQLLMVSVPSPKNYNYKKINALRHYAKQNGIPYVDMNLKAEEIGMDWSKDSYDGGDHLNIHGAQKVTAYLGKYLKENYGLPDRRNDAAYSSWNTLAEKFDTEVKQKTGQ